jgi:hypothetical protein
VTTDRRRRGRTGIPRGLLRPRLTRRTDASIVLAQPAHGRITRREARPHVLRGAVIDDDDLQGNVQILCQHRVQRQGKEVVAVEHGDDDGSHGGSAPGHDREPLRAAKHHAWYPRTFAKDQLRRRLVHARSPTPSSSAESRPMTIHCAAVGQMNSLISASAARRSGAQSQRTSCRGPKRPPSLI